MRILHTESSSGWGGQEIRILREAVGMRTRGHELFLAVAKGGGLVTKARQEGFLVEEIVFSWSRAFLVVAQLVRMILKQKIDLVVTHSSRDAWLGGIAARLTGKPIVRLRHLSTPSRAGINSLFLYKGLADFVVTTSTSTATLIAKQAKLSLEKCRCVATGVEPRELEVDPEEVRKFREKLGVEPGDCLVGTACVVRSWKGVADLLKAAALLKDEKRIKWVIIGGGYLENFKPLAKELGLDERVIFVGHLDPPFTAIASLDLFLLLSTAHEGISQASLQAAFLGRPLVTTPTGGLPEVCLDGVTGLIVPPFSPERVAESVRALVFDPHRRKAFGGAAKKLVEQKFTFAYTLEEMEKIYRGYEPTASANSER